MQRLTAAAWAAEQFGGARLGDVRRTRRLVESARRVALRPGGSLPRLMADPAALQGLYRLTTGPKPPTPQSWRRIWPTPGRRWPQPTDRF